MIPSKLKISQWTTIIPAAGKSSRFKFKKNKIFFKIKNKTILEKIILKIHKYSSKIVIIASKNNIKDIKKIVSKFKNFNIDIAIQHKSNGMAAAIQSSFPFINSKYLMIIWADQIGLSKRTIRRTMYSHKYNNYFLTFPIVYKKNPYTYIKIKNKKFLSHIIQSRENNIKNKHGYCDCGFFCSLTEPLKKELNHLIKNKKQIITRKTKEYDFLMSLNVLAKKYDIGIVKSYNKKDTLGINTIEDLKSL